MLDEEGISASVRVSSRPEKIRKKQDDHESASHFKLLEEPRQKISEDETFEAVYQGRHYESKRSKAGIRFRGRGSEEENGNSREPGKDEKHQRFADHSPTCRSFLGICFHSLRPQAKDRCPYSDGREKTATKYKSADQASNPWTQQRLSWGYFAPSSRALPALINRKGGGT